MLFHRKVIIDGKIRALRISGTYVRFQTDLRAYDAYINRTFHSRVNVIYILIMDWSIVISVSFCKYVNIFFSVN